MHEDDLRLLVRDAVARHLGHGGQAAPAPVQPSAPPWAQHTSHGRFAVLMTPVEPDTPCIVEPAVHCHHCGFCQSYGH